MKESIRLGTSNRTVAMHKGKKVAVYTVDKTEISLARQDLVELINVCSILFIHAFAQSLCRLLIICLSFITL